MEPAVAGVRAPAGETSCSKSDPSPASPPPLHCLSCIFSVHLLSLLVSHLDSKPTESCLMAAHPEQSPKLLGLGREQGAHLSYCPPPCFTPPSGQAPGLQAPSTLPHRRNFKACRGSLQRHCRAVSIFHFFFFKLVFLLFCSKS